MIHTYAQSYENLYGLYHGECWKNSRKVRQRPIFSFMAIPDRLIKEANCLEGKVLTYVLPRLTGRPCITLLEWRFSERIWTVDKLSAGKAEAVIQERIKRAQNGDTNAMSELYEHYKPAVYRYLYFRCGAQPVAEELTTEVFIRVIENLPRYKVKSTPFQAWLFRIARNLVIDHYRRSNIRQHLALDENLAGTKEGTESIVERRLDIEELQQALRKLSPDQCDVIVMRFLADMPISQVAQTLKKSQGAVKMLQARALKSLNGLIK
jgi:RNA polymerase sigma-70 factor, ECF subfamily